MYKLRVFSPNSSCAPLRNMILPKRILLRLGSTTPLISKFKYIELNSIDGIRKSANKILMKKCFDEAGIHHSEWINSVKENNIIEFFKEHKIIIAKHKHSSKGNDIYYIDTMEKMIDFLDNQNFKEFVFEKYYFFPQEYRVHVDVNNGCFYACKKVLKEDADVEWHKHANNSVFVLAMNPEKRPACWNDMIEDCQKIMKNMKLDIICFDVLCSNNEFIIVESNTAPCLANNGINYYCNHLNKYFKNR